MHSSQYRFYKVKKPVNEFLCALCRAPRQMKYKRNLSFKNYIQLMIFCIASYIVISPIFGLKSLYLISLIWPLAELVNKIMYRNEIPCPYCGFDATWYKRDVKIARQKVEDFWKLKNCASNSKEPKGIDEQELKVSKPEMNTQSVKIEEMANL